MKFRSQSILFFLVLGALSCQQEVHKTASEKSEQGVEDREQEAPESKELSRTELAETLKDFIPKNYQLLDSASGDLNLDEYPDLILVLKKMDEEKTSDVVEHPEFRPLLILINQENKAYKEVNRNDQTVLCVDCGGIMGDPYTGISIKKGYFSVEHYGGSAWRWTRIVTYKYSESNQNWYLHQDGSESYHNAEPDKVEKEIKTKKDFGIVPFEAFSIYDYEDL